MLTMRAVAMATRMRDKGMIGAVIIGTPNQHLRAKPGSADFHPGQGFLVAWQYSA
jgi:hypothetical protein